MHYRRNSSSAEVLIDHNIGRTYIGFNARPLLSIKCMFNGQARYVADGRRAFVVDDASYVVLNHGNPYSIEKRFPTPVETFCVFFPPDLVADAARGMLATDAQLLSDPAMTRAGTFNFLEHRRAHGDEISRRMLDLRRTVTTRKVSGEWLEEQLLVLFGALMQGEASVRREIAALPRARIQTRTELFRRVHIGRDHLHANLDAPPSLATTAALAAMSPYHFLRSFRDVFGVTPRTYVACERLRRAGELLLRTSLSVTEISAAVGFSSLPTFSNAFRQRFGVSPLRYRNSK